MTYYGVGVEHVQGRGTDRAYGNILYDFCKVMVNIQKIDLDASHHCGLIAIIMNIETKVICNSLVAWCIAPKSGPQ